jgi:hypothetical protein
MIDGVSRLSGLNGSAAVGAEGCVVGDIGTAVVANFHFSNLFMFKIWRISA